MNDWSISMTMYNVYLNVFRFDEYYEFLRRMFAVFIQNWD